MDSGRDAVDQTQSIEGDERRVLAIGKPFAPKDGSEGEDAMRGDAPCDWTASVKLSEIGRRSLQRRRCDESAEPLASVDQSFVNKDLDRPRDGEAADPKPPGELGSLSIRSPGALVAISIRSQSTSCR